MVESKKFLGIVSCPLLALFLFGFYALGSSLKVLALAFAVAYLTHPLVIMLERRGLNRKWTVFLVFAGALGVLTLFAISLIPMIVNEAHDFALAIPEILKSNSQALSEFGSKWNLPFNLTNDEVAGFLSENLQRALEALSKPILSSVGSFISGTWSAFLWLLNLFLFPIFFFFLMADFEEIQGFFRELIPARHRGTAGNYVHQCDQVLSGYIRGQLIVCALLACIYALGFSICGIRFGFLIGIIAGILSLIPYCGAVVGLGGALLSAVSYSESTATFVGIALVITVAQLVDGLVLTPRLVGNRVGLGILATMLALIAGANIAGVFGMMIAVPTAGLLKIVVSDLFRLYKESQFYRRS
jgi:predicted PurR-regulated permease PerM